MQKTEQIIEDLMKKRHWSLDQWKYSKDIIDRTVYLINYLSPHNLWKGYEAIQQIRDEALQQQKQEIVEEIKGMINNPKKYTWIDREGMNLIEEITIDLDSLTTQEKDLSVNKKEE